jgi:hypothetical protein
MLQTILLFVVLAGAGGGAQGPAQADQGARGRPPRPIESGLSPADVVSVLDGYAVVQAQNALELNDNQFGQFVTRLRALHQTRRRAQQERNRLLQELRRLAGPKATQIDENAIRINLKALRDLDERTVQDMRRAYDAVDEVLDARQQARFRVFEETLERRKLDLLMRARQGAAGPRR